MKELLKEYFNMLSENLVSTLNTPDAYLNKLAVTTILIIIGVLLHILVKSIIKSNVNIKEIKIKLNKISRNSIIILVILFILFIQINAINVLVIISLIAGTLAIVMLRGLTNNIIGFFIIKYRKYFRVGYRVKIGDTIGDVIDMNFVNFKLLEVRNWLSSDSNTGRIIKKPNSIIFEESVEMIDVENIYVWHEINYVISFDSDQEEAERIMKETGNIYFEEAILPSFGAENRYLPNEEEELKPVFSLNTNDDGIIVNLRYLVDYRDGTKVKTGLQRKFLTKFEKTQKLILHP